MTPRKGKGKKSGRAKMQEESPSKAEIITPSRLAETLNPDLANTEKEKKLAEEIKRIHQAGNSVEIPNEFL